MSGAAERVYRLRVVPDLSLNKYAALDGDGPKSVLEQHRAFWRQLNRRGILLGESYQLIYAYDPRRRLGQRMTVLLRIAAAEKGFFYADETMTSGPLSPYFALERCKDNDPDVQDVLGRVYACKAHLIKNEVLLDSLSERDKTRYYAISEWKQNDEARLYSMLRLMSAIDQPCAYCVHLLPQNLEGTLRQKMEHYMNTLRAINQSQISYGSREAGLKQKDENARTVLKQYEKILKKLDSTPCFLTDVQAFADQPELTRYLLDAAAADALEEGTQCTRVYAEEKGVSLREVQRTFPLCAAPDAPEDLACLPHLFGVEEVAAFAVLPTLYPGEYIELPKETVPPQEPEGLNLGQDEAGHAIRFPLRNMSKHVFVAGVPGSGKTNSLLHIITELHGTYKIPVLVLEPAKHEYRELTLLKDMEDVELFAPGGRNFPLHINPFEFPEGMPLKDHINNLMQIFSGAFTLDPPMPFVLDQAVEEVYRRHGWHYAMINRGKLPYPSMSELYEVLEQMVENTSYDGELQGNLRSALELRIGSLMRREMGDVFDVPRSTIAPQDWLKRSAVLELEQMGEGPSNFLTLLLATLLRETLSVQHYDPKKDQNPRHVLVLEEAHNLIGPDSEPGPDGRTDAKIAATAYIEKMLAEVRALGEGIIIADQLPTAMAPKVLKNTSLKIALRIVAQDDKQLLGGTMSADNTQLERMGVFSPGHALINYEPLLKPFEVQIPLFRGAGGSPDTPVLQKELLRHARFREDLRISMQIMQEKWKLEIQQTEQLLEQFEASVQSWEALGQKQAVPDRVWNEVRQKIAQKKETIFQHVESLFLQVAAYVSQREEQYAVLKNGLKIQDKEFEILFRTLQSEQLSAVNELFKKCAASRTAAYDRTKLRELQSSLRGMKNVQLRNALLEQVEYFQKN